MSIRSLIIDDEPLARQSIRRFLRYHPDIECCVSAAMGNVVSTRFWPTNRTLSSLMYRCPSWTALPFAIESASSRCPQPSSLRHTTNMLSPLSMPMRWITC